MDFARTTPAINNQHYQQWSFAGFGLACLWGRSQSLVNPQWSFAGCGLAGGRGRFQFIVKLQVDCVGNSLAINALHTSKVGAGFIPALAAADEKSSKCPADGRVGINPTTTVDMCRQRLRIKGYDSYSAVGREICQFSG